MSTQFLMEVRSATVLRALQRAEAKIRPVLRSRIGFWARQIEGDAKERAPVDTGRLRSSVGHEVTHEGAEVVGRVGTNVVYAPYVEFGTRPHWVPAAALAGWIKRHGLQGKMLERTGLWVDPHRTGKKRFVPFSVAPQLREWARARGVLERKALSVRGRKQPFMQPAFERHKDAVQPDIEEHVMKALEGE